MNNTGFMKKITGSALLMPLITLAILLLYNLLFTKNFFVIEIKDNHLFGNLIDILKGAAPIMILSIGLTLVIATKGIDISVGSIVAISASVVAIMIGGNLVMKNGVQVFVTNYPMFVALFIAVFVATITGMWNGMLVSRIGMQPIIATLILFVAGRGIAQLVTNGQIITIYYEPFFYIANGYLFGLPFALFIVLAVLALTGIGVRKTAIGLFIESVGVNPEASRFSGINAKNIIFWVYAFSGFCAGVAGLIVCSNIKAADGNNAGNLFELDAILAVVLGGTSLNGGRFHLVGSVLGALIIQTLTTSIYQIGVSPEISMVVKAMVIFIVSVLQSDKFKRLILNVFVKKEF